MTDKPKVYRILRVLEYVGTAEFINDAINKRNVKGRFETKNGNFIQESILGETPELLALGLEPLTEEGD